MSDARAAVSEAVCAASLCLDDDDFEGFLALCVPDFRYSIEAYSPEIRRDMTWLDLGRAELEVLFRTLPRHNSDHAPLTRHVSVYTVRVDEAGQEATAVSALQVFRTALDGGATSLFAVGKIYDALAWDGARALLRRRRVRLATRLLGIGSHKPL
ncbi:MAG TPA: aromatic-ring-hydroxylating dioxygenase subunit beta [Polyangia bacterium]|nr:aromatic-ring-hydroxylating dioxygenase subunit beta [Polyangia bacterium]